MLLLKNMTAVVTGAGQGIGFAVANMFARDGAKVVINDLDAQRAARACQQLRLVSPQVSFVAGDVSSATVAEELTETAIRDFGSIDILINNAGTSGSAFGDGPVASATEDAWDQVLRINLKSVYQCCHFVIPKMIQNGGGSIVNVSSVLALVGDSTHFTSHAYVASKGAILSLTRAMSTFYASHHIRVNAICPGLIDTGLVERVKTNKEVLEYVKSRQRLGGRLGTAEEVAAAIFFLASPAASFITGAGLPIDAGWSAGI